MGRTAGIDGEASARMKSELAHARIRNDEQQYQKVKRDPNFPQLKVEDFQDNTDWRKLPTLITV